MPVQKKSSPDAFARYGLERMTQLLKRRAGQLPAAVHEARCVFLGLVLFRVCCVVYA